MRALLISLFLLMLAQGQALANDLKIGYVNTERLFRDSPLAVKTLKKLEQEFAKRDQDIQKMVKQAREAQQTLDKENLTTSEAEKVRKGRELAAMTREIQRAQREYREDINQRRNEEFSAIQEKARKLIQDIAEREKFDLILENAIHASPRVDITDRIMKLLER
jgi:outer membrane protein